MIQLCSGGFGWFRVGSGGFGWFRVVSGGFGWFRVVPCLSMYDYFFCVLIFVP